MYYISTDIFIHFNAILEKSNKWHVRWTDPPTKESYQMSVDREVH
jgi:hypothetical protein